MSVGRFASGGNITKLTHGGKLERFMKSLRGTIKRANHAAKTAPASDWPPVRPSPIAECQLESNWWTANQNTSPGAARRTIFPLFMAILWYRNRKH